MATPTMAELQAELKDLKRQLGLLKPQPPAEGVRADSREAPLTDKEIEAIPINYIHLKSPDGFIIHKMPGAYRRQKEKYKDYVRVNRDGSELKPGPKPKEGKQ